MRIFEYNIKEIWGNSWRQVPQIRRKILDILKQFFAKFLRYSDKFFEKFQRNFGKILKGKVEKNKSWKNVDEFLGQTFFKLYWKMSEGNIDEFGVKFKKILLEVSKVWVKLQ